MKRFRTITAICLTVIAMMVGANIRYLFGLYNSIKTQTFQTVTECLRRADILEIINRMSGRQGDQDDSFIRMTLIVQGEKLQGGGYDYTNILENMAQTMSSYFHLIDRSDNGMPCRNYSDLDTLFKKELHDSGIYPEIVSIIPIAEVSGENDDLWSIDFSVSETQPPIFKASFSPLNSHILRRMSGFIVTSAIILVVMAFLIWYLLHWVGRLRTIEQMKDDFTHNMTHELKTPVAVAYSAADSMLRYYDQSNEARNKQFLKIIMQRLSFLSGMIENILSMSMERFKTMQLNKENISVSQLVSEVAGMIKLKAEKTVSIAINIPDDAEIFADPLHFGNIISNLLDNAVKYSYDSVDITIKGDSDSLAIADNGIGIAKENLPNIFDKFYRITDGDKYEVGGYGLGLFYVKQVVALMGWQIEVASSTGKGTSFKITFNGKEKR